MSALSILSVSSGPSLLDSKEFIAELDGLEHDVRGFVERAPRGESWNPLPEAPRRTPIAPAIGAEEEPPLKPQGAGNVRRLPVLVFALFMCLGASGAAAVFHTRVAQIVGHWHAGR